MLKKNNKFMCFLQPLYLQKSTKFILNFMILLCGLNFDQKPSLMSFQIFMWICEYFGELLEKRKVQTSNTCGMSIKISENCVYNSAHFAIK